MRLKISVLILFILYVLLAQNSLAAAERRADSDLGLRVGQAVCIFVTDSVLIRPQHPSYIPLGFTDVRFNCVMPLKGDLGREWSYPDVALLGFSNSEMREEKLGSDWIIFVNPLPETLKKYAVRGVVKVPGQTPEDIKAALLPATEDNISEIKRMLERQPLASEAVIAEVSMIGSWGRGLIWKMQIKNNGKADYWEFAKKDLTSNEEPKQVLHMAGAISAGEAEEFVQFLGYPGQAGKLPVVEDADEITFLYRKPGLVFGASVSAAGKDADARESFSGGIIRRVQAIKAKLSEQR